MVITNRSICVTARKIIALLSQAMLRLFRSTVTLAEFIQLRIKPVFELGEPGGQVPEALDMRLKE